MARRVKPAKRRFGLGTKPAGPAKPINLSAFKIFRASWRHLMNHKRVFFGVVVIYLLLTIVLVKGFGISTGVGELKELLNEFTSGATGQLSTGITLFTLLLTSAGSTASAVTSLYQTMLLIIVSLALIWALRQTHADRKFAIRDAFYKGMYPLIPFLLLLALVCVEFLPLLLSGWVYNNLIAGGILIGAWQLTLAWLAIILMVLGSLYWLASSVMSLYIVTLPNMTPLKALRSARELVRGRRWAVIRKGLALPLFLLLLGAAIMLPIIMFFTPLADWTFFLLNMIVVAVLHSYFYSLYRELL